MRAATGGEISSRRLIAREVVDVETAAMTTTMESTDRPKISDADLATPPMEALGRLSLVRAQIDEQIATLIGRLAPYVSRSIPAEIKNLREATPRPGEWSALEERIEDEISAWQEIAANLDNLLATIRL